MGLQPVSFNWHYDLIVLALHCVAAGQLPQPLAFGLVVLELALEVAAVGVGPPAFAEPVLDPFADVLHAGCVEDVGALTVFFAVEPVAAVDVFVGIDEHAFTLFLAAVPLPVILTLIGVD